MVSRDFPGGISRLRSRWLPSHETARHADSTLSNERRRHSITNFSIHPSVRSFVRLPSPPPLFLFSSWRGIICNWKLFSITRETRWRFDLDNNWKNFYILFRPTVHSRAIRLKKDHLWGRGRLGNAPGENRDRCFDDIYRRLCRRTNRDFRFSKNLGTRSFVRFDGIRFDGLNGNERERKKEEFDR